MSSDENPIEVNLSKFTFDIPEEFIPPEFKAQNEFMEELSHKVSEMLWQDIEKEMMNAYTSIQPAHPIWKNYNEAQVPTNEDMTKARLRQILEEIQSKP